MIPVRRAAARCRRTAVAAAVLAACVPALVLAAAAGAAWADDDGTTPVEHLTLSPSYGGAHVTVRIRAQCATGGRTGGGRVSSPAFVQAVALHRTTRGEATATAVVRDGLKPGTRYVVTANCSPVESLSASFAYTGRRPTGSAHAGYGAGYHPVVRAAPADGGVDPATLALGGGLAGVGLAGYVLTARRHAAARHGGGRGQPMRPTEQGGRR